MSRPDIDILLVAMEALRITELPFRQKTAVSVVLDALNFYKSEAASLQRQIDDYECFDIESFRRHSTHGASD